MQKLELLAPAGDLECLETALHCGADAVYLGGPQLQLRSDAVGFSMETLARAVEIVHRTGRRLYVTVNAFAKEGELPALPDYARALEALGVDAVIAADLGVIAELRRAAPGLPVHVSTQANCCNSAAARVFHELGASRIVLAREMTLPEISALRAGTPPTLELEAFVHGAMCMAYSGRCMLSAYMTGRSGNRGACAQPCRWHWTLMEESRPGEYFPVYEDGRGMTLLSSRDLCAVGFLDRLIAAGITSFKIEGRMKTPYYVGTVTNVYRRALDALARGEMPDTAALMAELRTVSHRDFSRGFYFGEIPMEPAAGDGYRQDCVFAGVVRESSGGRIIFQQRNRVRTGDRLEVVSPGREAREFPLGILRGPDGAETEDARLPAALYEADCPLDVSPGDLLRLRRTLHRE